MVLKTDALTFKTLEKTIIEQVSLTFETGLIYGILGPNGSGKTTFLKVLTGIWKATSGHVFWKGQNLLAMDRQTISQMISLVPQNAQVNFDFTVAEVVEMGTYPCRHLNKEEKKKRVQEALEIVNVWDLRDLPATHISHGERQRMYIARSLVTHSPILILDEPTSNLDIRYQLEIWELLKRLKQADRLIIVANHDFHATEQYCDHVAVFNHGKCVSEGNFSDTMTPLLISTIFGVEEMIPRLRKFCLSN